MVKKTVCASITNTEHGFMTKYSLNTITCHLLHLGINSINTTALPSLRTATEKRFGIDHWHTQKFVSVKIPSIAGACW